MISLMGCADSLILNPWTGSISFGGEMFTPAIGPATDGLSGVSLFCASHPASTTESVVHSAAIRWLYVNMWILGRPEFQSRAAAVQPRAETLSAGTGVAVRGAWHGNAELSPD